jgi:competence protein ComFA
MDSFLCPRCGNQDLEKTALKQSTRYCRVCIAFSSPPIQSSVRPQIAVDYHLPFQLSSEQLTIANGIITAYHHHQSVMVDAVTGSGKTEIVFPVIQAALKDGKQVGFVIPRTDVVIDMVPRFKQAFPTLDIISVYGDHHDNLVGDIIILTTHQMYRYQDFFDVLIFDEVDAFPYHGDSLLARFVHRATKGIIIYLSATFSQSDLKQFREQGGKIFHLFKRYHHHPIPNLTLMKRPWFFKWVTLILLIEKFKKQHHPLWIFVPTIGIGWWVKSWLKLWMYKPLFTYASSATRAKDVHYLKEHPDHILITTSILERGVTLAYLNIIIFSSDHDLMTKTVLIQMAGRVGRKIEAPTGKVIALCDYETIAMREAVDKINFANEHL